MNISFAFFFQFQPPFKVLMLFLMNYCFGDERGMKEDTTVIVYLSVSKSAAYSFFFLDVRAHSLFPSLPLFSDFASLRLAD